MLQQLLSPGFLPIYIATLSSHSTGAPLSTSTTSTALRAEKLEAGTEDPSSRVTACRVLHAGVRTVGAELASEKRRSEEGSPPRDAWNPAWELALPTSVWSRAPFPGAGQGGQVLAWPV